MNEPLVRADHAAKRYRVLKRQRSTLRALKALWGPEKLFMELWALRDVSFAIRRGEKVAVIGGNGSGKTTLLRLVAGIIAPSAGSMTVAVEPLALFKFWIGQNADLPVIDNIYLFGAVCGMKRQQTKPLVAKILDAADITRPGLRPAARPFPGPAPAPGPQHRVPGARRISRFRRDVRPRGPGILPRVQRLFHPPGGIAAHHDHDLARP